MEQEENNNVEDSRDLSTDNNESYEQDDTANEGEGETSDESNVEREPETPEQRSARIKRQAEREAKKQGITLQEYLGIESKEGSKKPDKKEEKVDTDSAIAERLDRGDLRYEGIKDKGEQDIIMEYANWKGMDVLDAMNTGAVKAELKEYRAKQATPSPAKRTSQGNRDDVAYWAEQMKKGNRAPTAELRTKAREYLAKNR